MYREPATPSATRKRIVLPRDRVPRVILGVCLWFLCFWFLIWPVVWVVQAIVMGEGLWRLAVAPVIWLAIVWSIIRLMRFDQLHLSSEEITRGGFFRDHRMKWSDVRGFEERKKYRSRGGPVRLYALLADHGELLVAPDIVIDPERQLRWAIERAAEGDLRAIDERVRAHGILYSPWPRRLVHIGIGLVLSVAVGSLLWGDQRRRLAERVFRQVDGEPFEVRVAALEPILDDDGLDSHLRCRAGTRLMSGATFRGELDRAGGWCGAMAALDCAYPVDCPTEPYAVLGQVQGALDAGDAQGALALLGALRFQGAFRDSLEVRALRETGSPEMARVVAERCVERYAETEDPAIRGFAERCREAL